MSDLSIRLFDNSLDFFCRSKATWERENISGCLCK